jgi:CMP-N,N'-diacetyllegionaminic acid synthase
MSIVALIPARSGSKGVPGKNINSLGGFPLMAYSIIAAKMINVDRVIVSTDSEEYAQIANYYGAETPFIRPQEIAGDKSSDLEFFQHAINWFKNNENNNVPEFLLHLRPTTPLRNPGIMQEAINRMMESKEASSLRSGHLAPESPFKWFLKDAEGYFQGLRDDLTPEKVNLPRQAFPSVYVPDGYIDIIRSSSIIQDNSLHGEKMLVFESPNCVEVDTIDDFNYLEYQLKKEGSPILDYLKSNFNSIK